MSKKEIRCIKLLFWVILCKSQSTDFTKAELALPSLKLLILPTKTRPWMFNLAVSTNFNYFLQPGWGWGYFLWNGFGDVFYLSSCI